MTHADLLRHLNDLRTGSYEGARGRSAKEAVFSRAVDLIDPIIRDVLGDMNEELLLGSGEILASGVYADGQGGTVAVWELSWPEQRNAAPRLTSLTKIEPVEVIAWFGPGSTHAHLAGSAGGNWPFNVLDENDAWRVRPTIQVIAEAALHERIFQADWRIVPAARSGKVRS